MKRRTRWSTFADSKLASEGGLGIVTPLGRWAVTFVVRDGLLALDLLEGAFIPHL
jgi:hypothetical protein